MKTGLGQAEAAAMIIGFVEKKGAPSTFRTERMSDPEYHHIYAMRSLCIHRPRKESKIWTHSSTCWSSFIYGLELWMKVSLPDVDTTEKKTDMFMMINGITAPRPGTINLIA